MIEKMIKGLIIGGVSALILLIGAGWKAYGEIQLMGKTIKSEVKEEMLEYRNNDIKGINDRFDSVDKRLDETNQNLREIIRKL